MIDRHPNYQIPWARVRLMAGDRPGTTRLTEFGLATYDGTEWSFIAPIKAAYTLPDPATLAPGTTVVCGSALLVADSRPHLSLINGNPDQYHNGHAFREFPIKTTPFVVGGSGQYSSEPVLDSAGNQIGVKLICPASDASSNAWVDIVPPEGFGFLSDAGSITYLLGPSTGAHAQIIHTVGTDATFTTVTNYVAANSVRNVVDCEYPTALDADMYAGGLNLSTGAVCGAIRIKLRNNGTAAASSAIVYGVSLNKVARKGSIVLEFDDAFLSQYTEAYRYMRLKGVVGSIGVIAETVGKSAGQRDAYDYCSLLQLKEMYEAGWSMVTHGYFPHNSWLATRAAILADVATNQAYVVNNFDKRGGKDYILPAGQYSSPYTYEVLTELGFKTCRTTQMQCCAVSPHATAMNTPSVQFSAFVGLVALKKWYDRCKKYGLPIRFQGHRIVSTVTDSTNEISQADFRAFIDYIAPDIASGAVLNPNAYELNKYYY